jgi:extracellular factor (EF) 3-hydroxypalmitic acid methyl ester biosynthesis protein
MSDLSCGYVAAVDAMARLLGKAKDLCEQVGSLDEHSVLNSVFESTLPGWRDHLDMAAASAKPLRDAADSFTAAKQYTQALLLPLLKDGPIWRRSFEKPRGYPGDFGVLNYVYDQSDEGDTVYARLCHRLGLDVGACVRTRMEHVVTELVTLLRTGADEFRFLSLGCGSAREVATTLARIEPTRATSFVLLDQDPEALAAARSFVEPAIDRLGRRSVTAEYVRLDYGRLSHDVGALRPWAGQDMVYCIGLLDYVTADHLEPLVATLFSLLKPGGLLILGNMKEPTSTFWPLEFLLNWNLVYRTEAQMRELARREDVQASELELEVTGNNFVLKLRKRTSP